MPYSAEFQMDLHCLAKYLFKGFQYTKGNLVKKPKGPVCHGKANLKPTTIDSDKEISFA